MTPRISHQDIEPSVAVGKNGVTDNIINEIKNQMKTRRIIKVRLHGESKLERLEIAQELAARTNSKLIDVRGFTIVLARKTIKPRGDG